MTMGDDLRVVNLVSNSKCTTLSAGCQAGRLREKATAAKRRGEMKAGATEDRPHPSWPGPIFSWLIASFASA